MCGIAGEIRFDGRVASIDRVSAMVRRMTRRGPDGCGVVGYGPFAFGHRRLQIIDLSERGRQPMDDPQLGLTVTFNGCIYNYQDLQQELKKLGYRFFSSSDTEVVLKAYHAWGKECVKRFNGMFAFAVYERDTGRSFLARDRLGIKPLYYTKSPGVVRFASTLPALLKTRRGGWDIDPVGLHYYMHFHSVVPAPRTLIEGIMKLEPGTTITFEPYGTHRKERYWFPQYGGNGDMPLDEQEGEITAALKRAVERRLTADVPVGVLLSGGLDSSLLVALLSANGCDELRTFSIGFEDTREERGNEFQYSDIVAKEFATKHERIEIDSSGLVEHLPDCFAAMSEPMVSHDNIGFYLLSQRVSEFVKVVQSGQGADEVFGGYSWYPPLMSSESPASDYAQVFFDRDHEEFARAIADDYVADDFSRRYVEEHFALAGAQRTIDKAMRLDTTVMLVEDPVKRVDNMTMAFGVEARVPFLDHELVEAAAGLPPESKIGDGGKMILKRIARKLLPVQVIDRPKGYFPVPALKYLSGESLAFVKDKLLSATARQRGVFREDYVDQLLREPTRHLTPLKGSKLWQLAALEAWMQTHGI